MTYAPTKAALINLTETLKVDLENFGVKLSIINPGFVDTPMRIFAGFPCSAIVLLNWKSKTRSATSIGTNSDATTIVEFLSCLVVANTVIGNVPRAALELAVMGISAWSLPSGMETAVDAVTPDEVSSSLRAIARVNPSLRLHLTVNAIVPSRTKGTFGGTISI